MNCLVFGSLNLDRTYSVPHFVCAGETLSAEKLELFCGGKGFNQAVALARAGVTVSFAGAIGADGGPLLAALEAEGIGTRYVRRTEGDSGHAVIQVTPGGENCIIVFPGANDSVTNADIAQVLADFAPGDWLVMQNEIAFGDALLLQAAQKGMVTVLNPSPWNARAERFDLNLVSYLLINAVEGQAITGCTDPWKILGTLHNAYPQLQIVLTLGTQGAVYCGADGCCRCCGIYPVQPVDTTAAGDTFAGYFLAEMISSGNPNRALRQGAVAGGLAVSRRGAAPSIPMQSEVAAVPTECLTAFPVEGCPFPLA